MSPSQNGVVFLGLFHCFIWEAHCPAHFTNLQPIRNLPWGKSLTFDSDNIKALDFSSELILDFGEQLGWKWKWYELGMRRNDQNVYVSPKFLHWNSNSRLIRKRGFGKNRSWNTLMKEINAHKRCSLSPSLGEETIRNLKSFILQSGGLDSCSKSWLLIWAL